MQQSKRHFMLRMATAAAALMLPDTGAAKTTAPSLPDGLDVIPVTVPWKSVINLEIQDPLLKKHVVGFLDRFEKSSFTFDYLNSSNGEISRQTLTGQDLLKKMKETLDLYQSTGLDLQEVAVRNKQLPSFHFVPGKFTLGDHTRPYDGTASSGSDTPFVLFKNSAFPLGVEIGRDYLKGAQYLGVDGKHHPVTVDQVVVHELAHVAFREPREEWPTQVEGIVLALMGAVQRDPRTTAVKFERTPNAGYQTLYDKLPASKPARVKPASPQPGTRPHS